MYFRYTQHISLLTKNEQQIPKTGVACSIQPKILGSEPLTEEAAGFDDVFVEKPAGDAAGPRADFS